jgi:hypothetical protein
MLKRKLLRALVVAMLSGVGVLAAAQSAQASVTVPPGASGSTCSGYQWINLNVFYQACAWASGGSSPRVWFTAHFGNSGNSSFSVDQVDLGFWRNGSFVYCFPQNNIVVPARGYKASTDQCYVPRRRAAYAAAISVTDSTIEDDYEGGATSPTLQVQ